MGRQVSDDEVCLAAEMMIASDADHEPGETHDQ